MPIQIIDPRQYHQIMPFTLARWTGVDPNETQGMTNPYYVSRGCVLSTFSYSTGSFITIDGYDEHSYACHEPFDFKANHKVYIEFTITPNLQVSGHTAAIFCEMVGSNDPNTITDLYPTSPTTSWPSYPDLVHIEPKDVYNSDGSIKILKNGKRQGKAYALIGYRSDDDQPNGPAYNNPNYNNNQSDNTGIGGFIPVQCFNSDIIMTTVAINGTPCVVPMPYFMTTNHFNAVITP